MPDARYATAPGARSSLSENCFTSIPYGARCCSRLRCARATTSAYSAGAAFDGLEHALADVDVALEQGMGGRLTHVGASARLAVVAGDIVKAVKVMDGLNRFRFRDQPDLLAAWKSASKVVDITRTPAEAVPGGEVPPAGSEVKAA